MPAITDALSTIVWPLCLIQSCTAVCATGTAKQRTAARPNPRSAHIEPLEPCFHLARITTPATKQTSNVGNCIANIESNSLIWSVLFINIRCARLRPNEKSIVYLCADGLRKRAWNAQSLAHRLVRSFAFSGNRSTTLQGALTSRQRKRTGRVHVIW